METCNFVWLPSLNIMFLRFSHIVPCISTSLFCRQIIFNCVDILHFVYLSIYSFIWVFLPFDTGKNAMNTHMFLHMIVLYVLSHIWFENIFSQLVICLFTFFITFFAQKFLILMRSNLLIFFFCCLYFDIIFWNPLSGPMSSIFTPIFYLRFLEQKILPSCL